jgi:glycerophosphoryl diester phosphodiesterase
MLVRLSFCLACVVSMIPFAHAGEKSGVMAPYTKPTLIAHRGASAYAPEHTLPAYRLALEQGADFVEPDLQITRDGVLVCLHDPRLERTTDVASRFPDRFRMEGGKKVWPVVDFTLAEIKTLDAGIRKDKKFAGTRVPTLQEMIDLVKGKAGIIPETKGPELYAARGFDMGKMLIDVLRSNGLDRPGADARTPVIIQSFSLESLKKLRQEQGCKLPLVYLFGTANGLETAEGLKKLKETADGIAPRKTVIHDHPELIRLAHEQGMSVTVWTCNEQQKGRFASARAEMQHLLDLGVDAIFTDNPDQFPRK